MEKGKKYFPAILISIITLGFLLRLYNLGNCDFWFDEAVSIARASFKYDVFKDIQPPLYYSLLSIWTAFFGEGEFSLRFLSLIFGTLSIIAIYKLGKFLFNRNSGLAAAFILAISPLNIWYSQEVRVYSLSFLLFILTVYYFLKASKENRNIDWIYFSVFSILSFYTNYFFVLFIPAAVIFALAQRKILRKFIYSGLATILFMIPLMAVFLPHLNQIRQIFWPPKPTFRSILITFENFNLGYSSPQWEYLFSWLVYGVLFIAGLFNFKNYKKQVYFCLYGLFLPLVITYLFAYFLPIYLDRQLMLFSPFYYLIIALGFSSLKQKPLKIVFFIASIFLICHSLVNYYSNRMPAELSHHIGVYPKKPYKPAVRYIESHLQKDDIIAHTNPNSEVMVYYANNKFAHHFFYLPDKIDNYWLQNIRSSQESGHSGWKSVDLSNGISFYGFKRIWLVTTSWPRDGSIDSNSQAVKKLLSAGFKNSQEIDFDGIFISCYTAQSP